jgi:hypothetical protein
MTDADVESKFRDLAGDALGAQRASAALQTLWRLDEAPRAGVALDVLTLPARA